MLNFAASRTGPAAPGNGHCLHAERFEIGVDFGFAVAAVGGDCPGGATEAGGDAGDGGERRIRLPPMEAGVTCDPAA